MLVKEVAGLSSTNQKYTMTREESYQALVALVALFHIFSQSFKLNCWNNHFNSFPMHGFPSCLGQYLEVECLNWNETNFSRTTQSQRFWQGVIWHVWTSQFDKHWRHSQKERLAYKLVDANWHKIEQSGNNKWHNFSKEGNSASEPCFLFALYSK